MDYIIVGCGYAGSILARLIAEKLDKKVLIIEKRGQIAGNMFDFYDDSGILVHKFGPHIAVFNEKKAFDFISRFTEWVDFRHNVLAEIDGKEVPLPINFTSIDILFQKEKAESLKNALIEEYGEGANIAILSLKESKNKEIREFAEFVFEKVFLHYTLKMWGLKPEEIDPAVTARIPVRLSYNNDHFLHKYQVMPKDGYTKIFENMLNHPNIKVQLNTDAKGVLEITDSGILYNGEKTDAKVIYTGALDELFDYEFGELPYRSLNFVFENFDVDYVQNSPVLNWPDDRPATRRTEMKRLTQQIKPGVTTTITEYPGQYDRNSEKFSEPYYPISEKSCLAMYDKYKNKADGIPNLYCLGRLADYKYYNMETTILRALNFFEEEIDNDK